MEHTGSESSASFCCDMCLHVRDMDLLCVETARVDTLLCVHCCPCEQHTGALDMPGTVIFPWRGLHESESRARRHS